MKSLVFFAGQRGIKIRRALESTDFDLAYFELDPAAPWGQRLQVLKGVLATVWMHRENTAACMVDFVGGYPLATLLTCRMAGVPFVLRLRGDFWHEMREAYDLAQSTRERLAARRQLRLVWLVARYADLIIPVSCFLKSRILAEIKTLDPARIIPAPVSIDLERFHTGESRIEARRRLGLPEEMQAIGTATNFAYRAKAQGLLDMQAVLAPLLERNDRLHWLIAGGGRLQSWFAQAVLSQAQCSERIHFLGHCSDISAVYRASDLFMHFSSMDAFPNTVLEAQACERPVIASNYGGMPEQIIAGETGYVVNSQETDAVQTLVERLLNDPKQRARMGELGRQFVVTHYSYATVGERFAQALGSLARAGDGASPVQDRSIYE